MHLYFHTNTEMAMYYIKELLSDCCEHSMTEIYDYVMGNCKAHTIMGGTMRATVISSAVWRLAHTEGSGYFRLRRGIYQMGDPKKTMSEKLSPYEKALRVVMRAEREIAGSFYVNLDQEIDVEQSIEIQKVGREVLDRLAEIKSSLSAFRQIERETVVESENGSEMVMG